jgi:transcriptional regulator with XRE-family HTH domain
MLIKEAVGHSIKMIRKDKELTLRDVSALSFISIGHLSEIEHGKKEASSQFLGSIARSLGVTTAYLLKYAAELLEKGNN